MEKNKHRPEQGIHLPFSSVPLEFDLAVPLSVEQCIVHLKRMTITNQPTEVVFVRVDPETQRFHFSTRAMRSHLIEAKGYIRQTGEQVSIVTGEIYGDTLASTLFAIALLAVVMMVVVFANLWALLAGAIIVGVVVVYCRTLTQTIYDDKRTLVSVLQNVLASQPSTD